jgi:N-acetylmuramoyl-L-alanine amidase
MSALVKAASLALLLCALCASALAAPLRTHRLGLFQQEYYRLDEWARANGFAVRWLGKKDVELTSKAHRLAFTGDSRRMIFDGVLVVLSHDVAVKDGTAYITPFDVSSTVNPLLWPARSRELSGVKHICIDPGHGGKDTGERSGREQEKTYTLLLAQELGAQLRKAGYTVSFTRTSDTFVDRDARTEVARKRKADLFVSIHFNAAPGRNGGDVRGVETYCVTPEGASSSNDARGAGNKRVVNGNKNNAKNLLLAYEIQKAIVRGAGSEDRGVKRARFEVLRDADMPAVLVESGFMTNPVEARKIYSSTWRRDVAASIVKGIANYRGATEKTQ